MARLARKISNTQIYHIMLRGINKQDIFLDTQDKIKFLKDLNLVKHKYAIEIYAYCLMPNHVHLIIKDNQNSISNSMQSIGIRYSSYMNQKYERVGHLFQNRYLSKPVETIEYLLHLQRYIHQNPLKAGLSLIESYKWSSYQEYVYQAKIVNTEFILNLFSEERSLALRNFKDYNHQIINADNKTESEFEFIVKTTMSDEELIKLIKEKLKIDNIYVIQQYRKKYRDQYIREILEIEGISINQISRVLGINQRTIYRVKEKRDMSLI